MGEQSLESDKHEISNEHAVLMPALPTVKSLLPYVEAVASVIGSCHIHSVYEDRDHIKIYLKDKRFVDILVNNGVSVLGRQINVDYAVPRADKIILSNIDPIVPDSILTKLLCYYGNPVSAIIHEKIATNSEYSHIECGKRKVYMKIFPDKKIPNKINFAYLNMLFRIDVLVEPLEREDVCEPIVSEAVSVQTEERIEEDINDEVESCISMKPDVENLELKKQPSEKQIAYRQRGRTKANSAANMAHRLKRRARKGWYGTRNNMAPKFTQQKKDKLKFMKKRLAAEDKKKSKILATVPKSEVSHSSLGEDKPSCSSVDSDGLDQSSVSVNEIPDYLTQYPLSSRDLMEFIKKTRFQRDPCVIAWEFLEKTPESLEALKIQLQEYYRVAKDHPLKLRIRRLIATLKFSKDTNNE